MIKLKKCDRCIITIVAVYLFLFISFISFNVLNGGNIELRKKANIYLKNEMTVEDVTSYLLANNVIKNKQKFEKISSMLGYNSVKGGRYIVKPGTSYKSLIRILRSGAQTPVNLVIAGNIRTKEKLASIISSQIEADSISILGYLNDDDFLKKIGFSSKNSILLFLPNTYNVYWNRKPEQLFIDMQKRYNAFWNEERTKKQDSISLSQNDVMILASIIIEESSNAKELPTIAGVYVNRLKKGMPLQADPTVKYAVGDFSIKRVLNRHTETESPYNTYKIKGLPPGPICIPSLIAIDAVLNYEHHDYLYFCAKDDFSGNHVFAKTLAQHNQNANAYRNALNRNKIYK